MDKSEFKMLLARAQSGDPEAMYLVGLEYNLGHVVVADVEEALAWMDEAAKLGHEDAKAWLDDYYFDDDANVQAYS